MINVTVEYVRHIQAGNTAIVAEDAKVRIRRYESSMENLFTQGVGEWMRYLAIIFHEPRMIGPRLEEYLTTAAACRIQIDQCSVIREQN